MIKVGDRVRTLAGDRITKIKHSGVVIRFTKWREFEAAVVKRSSDGVHKAYLIKNLVKEEKDDQV